MIDIYKSNDKRSRLCRCCGNTYIEDCITVYLSYKAQFNVCSTCVPVLIHELQRVLDGGEQRDCDGDYPIWIDDANRDYKSDDLPISNTYLTNIRGNNEPER